MLCHSVVNKSWENDSRAIEEVKVPAPLRSGWKDLPNDLTLREPSMK
jgi:hypothetical protein